MKATRPLIDRMWPRIEATESGCLVWTGSVSELGYGRTNRGRRGEGIVLTHRASWEFVHGPIPDGLYVCHRCDNPPCCNPDHLFLGTQRENLRDMLGKGRHRSQIDTHCKREHPITAANTYTNPTTGYKTCRPCKVMRNQLYQAGRRVKANTA